MRTQIGSKSRSKKAAPKASTSARSSAKGIMSKLPVTGRKAMKVVKSPLFIEAALVAGAGYLLWKNRSAIQSFIQGTGITEKISGWFGHESEESSNVESSSFGSRDNSYDSESRANQ